jgi:hypothetical protein
MDAGVASQTTDYITFLTSEDNDVSNYTNKDCYQAKRVCSIQRIMGRPSTQ